MDSYGKKAGKGPLIQEELSGTLGTSQDQYLFQAVGVDAYNQNLVPCVIHNFKADGAEGGDIAFAIVGDHENRPTDMTNTLVYVKSKRAKSKDDDETWKSGDVANTLNLFDQGDVRTTTIVMVNTIGGQAESAVVTDKSPTLKQTHFKNPPAVAYAIGNGQPNNNKIGGVVPSLDCMHDQKIVIIDRAAFNQGQNAKFDITISDGGVAPTVIAKGPSAVAFEPGIMERLSGKHYTEDVAGTIRANMGDNQMSIATEQDTDYIVRRLTPLECCRLQGFPDGWGEIDPKDDFTQDEYEFWLNVRNTFARINGRKEKEYTKDQMLTWYNKLHTDSAEYKMWGNGIALPCAMYVMEGIAIALREGETDDEQQR